MWGAPGQSSGGAHAPVWCVRVCVVWGAPGRPSGGVHVPAPRTAVRGYGRPADARAVCPLVGAEHRMGAPPHDPRPFDIVLNAKVFLT